MLIKKKIIRTIMLPLLEKTDEQTRGSLDPVQTVADLPNTKLPLILSLLSPSASSAVNSNQYNNSFHIEKRDAKHYNFICKYFYFLKK